MAAQFTPTKGISVCLSGMTLFTASNRTWLNVELILNSWNRAECSIASAGTVVHGSTQLNGKSIGTRKRSACTVSYANFARNAENSQMASELALAGSKHGAGCYIVTVSDRTLSYGRPCV